MDRKPPTAVRKALRSEVGFGCPVPGCGNPYLRWHHFDPPWRDREHDEVGGMIALCAEHHDKADAGAFTDDQLRAFKTHGTDVEVGAGFDWMRDKLLAVVGGNIYFDVPVPLQIGDEPIVWFNRDDEERFLLNVKMPTLSGEPRIRIEDNFWTETGAPDDLECPPKGTLVAAAYRNGDVLRVEFMEMPSLDAVKTKYPYLQRVLDQGADEIEFPCAAVEIRMGVKASVLDFGPRGSRIMVPGMTISGSFMARCGVGLHIG